MVYNQKLEILLGNFNQEKLFPKYINKFDKDKIVFFYEGYIFNRLVETYWNWKRYRVSFINR